jgi:para-aminobenzoate synthetase
LKLWAAQAGEGGKLPFDFCGGFVGYLGYEMQAECGGKLNQAGSAATPDAAFFFTDRLIAVDHATDDVYLLALHYPGGLNVP